MDTFAKQIQKHESNYQLHKGDKVSFHIKGKQYHGIVTGYLFYGADKFCAAPAFIVQYKTRFLHRLKNVIIYSWNLKSVKKEAC